MIISIFASIGSGNLGDELILKNEIKFFEDKYKGYNIEFKVFTYDVDNIFFEQGNIEYIEYFPIGIRKPSNIFRNIKNYFNFIKAVKKSDLIIVGGGGIFFDNEIGGVSNPLFLWYFRSIFFRIFNKKVIFNAIGIDIKNNYNLRYINKIFKGNIEVTVRDPYSKFFLDNLGIKSNIINDPVFYDKSLNSKVDVLKGFSGSIDIKNDLVNGLKGLGNIKISGKSIGLALRAGYIKDEENNIKNIIKYILKEGGSVILLPHSFHKDHTSSNDYYFLKSIITENNVPITSNMKETYSLYVNKKIDLCLAMRLHSVILSNVYNIPYISLSYSKKTDNILKKQ